MKYLKFIIVFLISFHLYGCISNFIPAGLNEDDEILVVEGLITDQPGINTIKLDISQPLWKNKFPRPLSGCVVTISDDTGHTYPLKESVIFGTYITDPAGFRGTVGRTYTLHIKTINQPVNYSYESLPMRMIPVPPIDSLYYEKKQFSQPHQMTVEGCNIYLNTNDPSNNCKFYRWEYAETWEFHLSYNFPNKVCWISSNSHEILIKNASLLDEARLSKYPVISISNPADRLSVKYSILVNQFSLNEDEYFYWERLKNTTDQTGGLYDIIPAAIPNNIYCLEEPYKKVLGYFGVSAVSSKRLFIKDNFTFVDMYSKCFTDTFFTSRPDTISAKLGWEFWTLIDNSHKVPPFIVYTLDRGCVDCTTRGTNIKPVFWDEGK
jgi:hypothetical protein